MSDQPSEPGSSSSGDSPSPADLSGTILANRYRILHRLGSGGMGAVYLGEHLRMGRKDAIKVLRAEMAENPDAIARFTRGARAVARIHHPNVCQIYDFGETEDGLLFLAMEFIEGPSLSSLLADEGRLKPDRAIRFIRQAGEALHTAHEAGIIHRDLKPDNLMVARDRDGAEQLKVVDFDIARGTEEEGAGVTRQGFVVGTPEYMSPEQLTGDTLDARSDIYSLALVLFRCLSGRLPFEGTTAQELMMQRLTVAPLRLSQAAPGRTFPPGLEDVLNQALSRLPDERPDSTREFARIVADTVEGSAGRSAAVASPQDQATQVAPASMGRTAPSTDAATRASPAGKRAETPPEAIPGTQVADSSGEAAKGESLISRHRAALTVGGGGMGLLAILLVGWLLVAPGANSTDVGDDMDTTPPGSAVQDEESDLTLPDPEESEPEQTPAEVADRGQVVDPPETTQPPETDREDPPPVQVDDEPDAEPATPVAGAQPVNLPAGDSRDLQRLIFDQFILTDEATGPAMRAVRDTVAAAWAAPQATRADSAFAAHVLGLTLIALGDSLQGVDWLREAVELDPLDRYITTLEAHQRPGR